MQILQRFLLGRPIQGRPFLCPARQEKPLDKACSPGEEQFSQKPVFAILLWHNNRCLVRRLLPYLPPTIKDDRNHVSCHNSPAAAGPDSLFYDQSALSDEGARNKGRTLLFPLPATFSPGTNFLGSNDFFVGPATGWLLDLVGRQLSAASSFSEPRLESYFLFASCDFKSPGLAFFGRRYGPDRAVTDANLSCG